MSNYGKRGDFLYDSTDLTIWTTVETCFAIVAACIPCLKPLFIPFKAPPTSTLTARNHTMVTYNIILVAIRIGKIGV